MEEAEDFSPSPTCRVCDRPSIPGSWACPRCRRLVDRGDIRAGRVPNMKARRNSMRKQWNRERNAFLCVYTGIELTETNGETSYATWEHRDPRDEGSVVLV